jgi:esterase/lipase superfamily enzyme
MNRNEGTFYSHHLGRDMSYIWFGDRGRPLVMLPTSAGRQNENEDFGLVGVMAGPVDRGELQVCSLDSINRDSWADDSLSPWEKLRRHELYDRFLHEEWFPAMAERTGRGDPILYGASLGGWQAATFAARHPESVSRVIAFSGFFDIRRITDSWWDERAYYFSPADFVANMPDDWVARLSRVGWVIATGEQDTLVDQTRNFAHVLRMKGIPVHEEVWSGVFGHDWPFWKEHLPRFAP